MNETVGTLLHEQLRARLQKEIAIEWRERWCERHPEADCSRVTVVSQLSRCLGDHPQGINFFFSREERATLLLDVLEVDEADRVTILEAARRLLEKPTVEPRVVFDCTPWTATDSATVLGAIMVSLGAGLELGPVVVLVTKEQEPQIPRGLTDLADVRYEVVSSPAQERVLELASDTALVVSKQRQDKLEYWMALDVVGGKVKMHPEDGLAIFAENHALPALPKVEHPLQELGVRAAESVELPSSTVEVRRWMFELADANSTVSARRQSDRVALASKLGVCATSTPNERDMHERSRLIGMIEKLGVEFNKKAKQEQLDEAIVQRSEQELPPTAMLINDEIHVVFDAKKPVAGLPDSPKIKRHPITTRVVIREVLEEVAGWGEDDHFADPHLDGLIGRIAPLPSPHRLCDAQAFLLLSGTYPSEVNTILADPSEALQAVLRGAVPATEVMVPVDRQARPSRNSSREKTIWWAIERPQFAKNHRALAWPLLPMSTKRFPVGRSTRLIYCDSDFVGWENRDNSYISDRHDNYVFSYSTIAGAVAQGETFMARFGHRNAWETTRNVSATTPKAPWDELDVEMGRIWLALLVAMRQPRLTMLHDGSALLALSGGVIARVRARTRPTKLEPPPRRACFVGELDSSHNLTVHRETVCTMQADAGGVLSKLLETLPREIILHGGGYEVRVSFTASNLVGPAGLDAREFATLAAITVQQLRQQEEEQRNEQQRLDEQREFEEQLRLDEERRQLDDDDDDEY